MADAFALAEKLLEGCSEAGMFNCVETVQGASARALKFHIKAERTESDELKAELANMKRIQVEKMVL